MKLLLDTNVLLLFLIGLLRPDRVGGRRLDRFILDDFYRVADWADEVSAHVSLPNILTEASNLLGDAKQELVDGGRTALAKYIATLDEIYVPSRRIAGGSEFIDFGLTDAAILYIANNRIRVVSVDHHLCNRLSLKGVDVRNPFHFR